VEDQGRILLSHVKELEDLVERDCEHMDGVNIATALHTLAHVTDIIPISSESDLSKTLSFTVVNLAA
jgi:hypothetical protein